MRAHLASLGEGGEAVGGAKWQQQARTGGGG